MRLLIDESDAPMRKVVVTGRADLVHPLGHDDEWRDMYRTIALRYVPAAWADAYLRDTIDEARGVVQRRPRQLGSDDLAYAGATRREPARGVGAVLLPPRGVVSSASRLHVTLPTGHGRGRRCARCQDHRAPKQLRRSLT